MTTKSYMLLGFAVFICASTIEVVGADFVSVAVFAFAGGALFGKGYGIWEERQRKRR
jgi:hypothetical protein